MQTIETILNHQGNDYPSRLSDLYDSPARLYIRGNPALLKLPSIAIVGSRAASAEGIENAALFAQALSRAGFVIISGLARGIDGAAHRATLMAGGLTVAICGSGLDVVYPKEHCKLALAIQEKGLLISEYPAGTEPKPFHFPKRNRLIAALALGIVVIEATEQSGSLITARVAAEMGREIFVLPGSIKNPLYRGCNRLIQQGAKLVNNPREVLEDLPSLKNLHLNSLKRGF